MKIQCVCHNFNQCIGLKLLINFLTFFPFCMLFFKIFKYFLEIKLNHSMKFNEVY